MRVLLPQRLARRQPRLGKVGRRPNARVTIGGGSNRVVGVLLRGRTFFDAFGSGKDVGTLVRELIFKVLGAED
jgi:hypothetical protein